MKRVKYVALAAMVCLCSGCDVGFLLNNADEVQGVIRNQVDVVVSAAANWALFLNEMMAQIPVMP